MKELQQMIDRAQRIVFFGGAGVSTESGIPDFRSENGLYRQKWGDLTPEMLLSASFFYLHPDQFFEFYRKNLIHPHAHPNAAHRYLYALEKARKLRGIVTQNIDGLHKQAGNRLVYEVHGSVHENYCMDCNAFYPAEFILKSKGVPKCPACGGVVKPWVVLYGEAPDPYTMMGAKREISSCDLMIIAGTSLTVEPAASLIDLFHGHDLVVINREETPADARASLVIRGSIAECFERLSI